MNVLAQRPRKLTVPEFLAFYETRPDEEQWQLVDGVAVMMTPPFVTHQRIASNLERLLNNALEQHDPTRIANQRIGLMRPEFPHDRPEPDVVVIDTDLPHAARHVERFYLVAEILSESDDERIFLKRQFYRAHEHNRAILMLGQQRPELELDRRVGDEWRTELLSGAEVKVELPDLGLSCRLGDFYRNTTVA